MTNYIKVTNKNKFEIKDYFEGICYRFSPNIAVNVPMEAMSHIFGIEFPADEAVIKSDEFRERVFQSVSRRWGWNSHKQDERDQYEADFSRLIFVPIIMQQVELVAKKEDIAEPRDKKEFKPAGKFKPRADEAEETSEEEVA